MDVRFQYSHQGTALIVGVVPRVRHRRTTASGRSGPKVLTKYAYSLGLPASWWASGDGGVRREPRSPQPLGDVALTECTPHAIEE